MTARRDLTPNIFHADYIHALNDGDAPTGDHFFSYFRPRLRSLLRKRGASTDEIDDLQQDTFVRVLTALKSKAGIHSPEKFAGFVNAVCTNSLFEQFRRRKQHLSLDESFEVILDDASDQHTAVISKEVAEMVRRVLARLSARDQELLRAVYLEEKDSDALSQELRVKSDYMRVLLYRAKRQFLNHLSGAEQKYIRRYLLKGLDKSD
jgi:RNA polymerase sigma-70 factor, ECF subfamily